jgi:hypothetical protein
MDLIELAQDCVLLAGCNISSVENSSLVMSC